MRTGAQDPEGMSVPLRRSAQGGRACSLVVPAALLASSSPGSPLNYSKYLFPRQICYRKGSFLPLGPKICSWLAFIYSYQHNLIDQCIQLCALIYALPRKYSNSYQLQAQNSVLLKLFACKIKMHSSNLESRYVGFNVYMYFTYVTYV